MVNTLELAREFHDKFLINNPHTITLNSDICRLRLTLLYEELFEVDEAIDKWDSENLLKELCDLQYVLDGTFLALGFAKYKDAAMLEVHRSNMSKLDKDGKPIYRKDGKVLKSVEYSPADMSKILKE